MRRHAERKTIVTISHPPSVPECALKFKTLHRLRAQDHFLPSEEHHDPCEPSMFIRVTPGFSSHINLNLVKLGSPSDRENDMITSASGYQAAYVQFNDNTNTDLTKIAARNRVCRLGSATSYADLQRSPQQLWTQHQKPMEHVTELHFQCTRIRLCP